MAPHYLQVEKAEYEKSLELIRVFKSKAITKGIEHEVNSIEKFYKSKLYDLERTLASF